MEITSTQQLYNDIKAIISLNDNSFLFSFCRDIYTAAKANTQQDNGFEDAELATKLASDPAFARGWMIQTLAEAALNGNTAAAAKELKGLLGVTDADNDSIQIQRIDYANACSCADPVT